MGTVESAKIASMVARVLGNIEDTETHRQVAEDVQELTAGFAVPGIDD
jgi:glycine/serine hydroxymethyltransferase